MRSISRRCGCSPTRTCKSSDCLWGRAGNCSTRSLSSWGTAFRPPPLERRAFRLSKVRGRLASAASSPCCSATWWASPSWPRGSIPRCCSGSSAATRMPARYASPATRDTCSSGWVTASSPSSDTRWPMRAKRSAPSMRAGDHRIAVQAATLPMRGTSQVRIGIATGLVVVSSAEKGAVGETMNLASRLQAIAQPGQHRGGRAGPSTGRRGLRLRRPGRADAEGHRAPHPRLPHPGRERMRPAASRPPPRRASRPLVGREQEIGLLLERWQLAQDGEGQVVLLSGEPGIGKSRILSALRERLEAQGAATLRFQCSPYYVNSAFWPSIDNFERALAVQPRRGARVQARQARGADRQPVRPAARRCALRRRRCCQIPADQRYEPLAMTPQKHKEETLRALVDLTEAAARSAPHGDAVRRCALGRPDHPRGARSDHRPGEERSRC